MRQGNGQITCLCNQKICTLPWKNCALKSINLITCYVCYANRECIKYITCTQMFKLTDKF